jgi:hypothetical protein
LNLIDFFITSVLYQFIFTNVSYHTKILINYELFVEFEEVREGGSRSVIFYEKLLAEFIVEEERHKI